MKYATPDEFIQAYLGFQLRKAEESASNWKELHYKAVVMAEDSRVKHDGYQQITKEWADNNTGWLNRIHANVDNCRNMLNDFLEGKYKPGLDLALWARLSTISVSNIEHQYSIPGFTSSETDVFHWAEWLCDNMLIYMNMEFDGTDAVVTITGYGTRIGVRRKVRRHGWYIFNEDDDPDIPDCKVATALTRALIAAYDHGLWKGGD